MSSLRNRIFCLLFLTGLLAPPAAAQPLRFAWLSDTHLAAG